MASKYTRVIKKSIKSCENTREIQLLEMEVERLKQEIEELKKKKAEENKISS